MSEIFLILSVILFGKCMLNLERDLWYYLSFPSIILLSIALLIEFPELIEALGKW